MIKFFNNDIFTEKGNSVKIVYSAKVNDDGTIELVPSGKEDWQAYIGSFADECDINVIVARFVNGDVNALNVRNGIFGDFSDMPKTYAEMLQLQINAKTQFDGLPVDVKEKFNNDFNQFIASAGTVDWLNKLGVNLDNYVKKDENSLDGEVIE